MLPDLTPFLELRKHVVIAHHVPGRIRLKLKGLSLGDLPKIDPAPFAGLLERLRGLGTVRVNRAALSIVVEYDTARVAAEDWARLLAGPPCEVQAILMRVAGGPRSVSSQERKKTHVT